MSTGLRGTFAVAWSQCETDGMIGAPFAALQKGAHWSWSGHAARIDGPKDVLVLGNAKGAAELRARAAKSIQKVVGPLNLDFSDRERLMNPDGEMPLHCKITDGVQVFEMMLVDQVQSPLAVFLNALPVPGRDYWVLSTNTHDIAQRPQVEASQTKSMICFADYTFLRTTKGWKSVRAMCPGDFVVTKDNGPKEVLWIGHRDISATRQHMSPELRPIRLDKNAFAKGQPFGDTWVSPNHCLLIKGRPAQDLFNSDEVLVAARDLLNGRTVYRDTKIRSVTYFHILLEQHEVIFANGLETESCHPGQLDLQDLADDQLSALYRQMPQLKANANDYSGPARRQLNTAETLILRHGS